MNVNDDHRQRLADAATECFNLINLGPAVWTSGSRELDILRSFVLFAEIAQQNGICVSELAATMADYVAKQVIDWKQPPPNRVLSRMRWPLWPGMN